MTAREAGQWTVEAVKEWAKDLFASRDEAIKLAREEAARVDEQTARYVRSVDARLEKLEDRANYAEPRVLTRREYEARHKELQDAADHRLNAHIDEADRRFKHIDDRLNRIEVWKGNVTGRVVGVGAIGVIFTAAVTALIAHLVGGG